MTVKEEAAEGGGEDEAEDGCIVLGVGADGVKAGGAGASISLW